MEDKKRICLSCSKFFDCKIRDAKKDGCIHYREAEKEKKKGLFLHGK